MQLRLLQRFLPVSVCVTQISVGGRAGGGGRQVGQVYTTEQVSRWGGFGGSGGGGKVTKQGDSPFTAKMCLFINRLLVSQTSERFLLEVKNVAFCIWILKSVKKLKSA